MKTRWHDRTAECSVQANPERAVAVAIYEDISFNELLLWRVFNTGKGCTFTKNRGVKDCAQCVYVCGRVILTHSCTADSCIWPVNSSYNEEVTVVFKWDPAVMLWWMHVWTLVLRTNSCVSGPCRGHICQRQLVMSPSKIWQDPSHWIVNMFTVYSIVHFFTCTLYTKAGHLTITVTSLPFTLLIYIYTMITSTWLEVIPGYCGEIKSINKSEISTSLKAKSENIKSPSLIWQD